MFTIEVVSEIVKILTDMTPWKYEELDMTCMGQHVSHIFCSFKTVLLEQAAVSRLPGFSII
jgi:muconolactone delta-isomerase